MDKLIILNYVDSTVHIYDCSGNVFSDSQELVESLGYDSDNCEWMLGEMEIIHHRESI